MKKLTIPLAGMTLALSQIITCAQPANPPPPDVFIASGGPDKPRKIERIEIEESDDSNSLGAAHAAVVDAERNVRRIFAGRNGAVERPLIISFSGIEEKSIESLEEDINIMARILNKAADSDSDEADRKAMGIQLWTFGQGGGQGVRNLYIEGHGALFLLNVNMPLTAPPSKAEPEERKEPGNSTWEQARRELYGREDKSEWKYEKGRPAPRYDAERVEELKKGLIEALKNASHIRGLKDNESVTVVVQGSGDSAVQKFTNTGPKGQHRVEAFAFAGSGSPRQRSTLTLRAKKSDIDAFAKGKLELDEFRKKVTSASYQSPSGGGGGESFILQGN